MIETRECKTCHESYEIDPTNGTSEMDVSGRMTYYEGMDTLEIKHQCSSQTTP